VLRELAYSVPFKAFAFAGTYFLASELLRAPKEYVLFINFLGWLNILKIFDLSIPYAMRVNFPERLRIRNKDLFIYAVLLSLFNIIVLYSVTEFSPITILLLTIASRIYSTLVYFGNVTTKSFLINSPLAASTLLYVICSRFGAQPELWSFLALYILLCLVAACYCYSDLTAWFPASEPRPFSEFCTTNYFYNAVTMSMWAVTSEFYSVYSIHVLDEINYITINQYLRVSLIFLGLGFIVSNVNWNHSYARISIVDRFVLTAYKPFIFLPGISIFVFLFAPEFSVIENMVVSFVSLLSVLNLHVSHICARRQNSAVLFNVAIIELATMFLSVSIYNVALHLLSFMSFFYLLKFYYLRRYAQG
jgi:hypothetical protein